MYKCHCTQPDILYYACDDNKMTTTFTDFSIVIMAYITYTLLDNLHFTRLTMQHV